MSEKIISEANMNKAGVYPGWKAKAAADKAAADAAQAAKTEVEVTQVQGSTNGTKIATIGVDDVSTDIYAPAVAVTQVQGSTGATKIATIGVGATSTDLYAPAGGAGVFKINFTYTDATGTPQEPVNPTVTADKTPAEVYAAYLAGDIIVGHVNYVNNFDYPSILTSVETFEQDSELYIMIHITTIALIDEYATPNADDGIVFTALYSDTSSMTNDWACEVLDCGYRYFYAPQA